MPDNTPGLDCTTKGVLGLISWEGAKLLSELFAAIEKEDSIPLKGEDDLGLTGYTGLAILSKI